MYYKTLNVLKLHVYIFISVIFAKGTQTSATPEQQPS